MYTSSGGERFTSTADDTPNARDGNIAASSLHTMSNGGCSYEGFGSSLMGRFLCLIWGSPESGPKTGPCGSSWREGCGTWKRSVPPAPLFRKPGLNSRASESRPSN